VLNRAREVLTLGVLVKEVPGEDLSPRTQ
jgi:hypothetical protein